ncbi:MAG: hypothetical protein K6F73_00750, partial [Lachnospiraceae bacterium]|nr:hypothetical protein [Lachnospiraceae bacterium]
MNLSDRAVSRKTLSNIRQLYPKGEAERRMHLLGREKIRIAAVTVIATLVFAVPVFISDAEKLSEPVAGLKRNGYGEGSRTVSLIAVAKGQKKKKVTVEVSERKYTEKELEEFSCELDGRLFAEILGNNTDSNDVTEDLELIDHLEGFPFKISWKTDRPLLIGTTGKIYEDRLCNEDPEDVGVIVQLRATLSYGDFTQDKYSSIVLRRRKISGSKSLAESVEESVAKSGKESETGMFQILPKSAGGQRIAFYDASPNRGWGVLLIGAAVLVLVLSAKDRKIQALCDERRKQMNVDHPIILNQYMLYFLAGMNPRAIWYAMCRRYEESLEISSENRRYVYDEMVTARNRMDEGCGEIDAYEEFARRCDSSYRTFICFVKQAAVKGNDGLG